MPAKGKSKIITKRGEFYKRTDLHSSYYRQTNRKCISVSLNDSKYLAPELYIDWLEENLVKTLNKLDNLKNNGRRLYRD